jgi:hypothetical protein
VAAGVPTGLESVQPIVIESTVVAGLVRDVGCPGAWSVETSLRSEQTPLWLAKL